MRARRMGQLAAATVGVALTAGWLLGEWAAAASEPPVWLGPVLILGLAAGCGLLAGWWWRRRVEAAGDEGGDLDITSPPDPRHALPMGGARDVLADHVTGFFRSHVDGRLLDCNDACARIYGYRDREELLKADATSLYRSPEDREAFLDLLRQEGELISIESRGRHRDGHDIWLLENVSLHPDERGEPSIIVGSVVDITARRRLEAAIRSTQKMEAIGRLAGGVAHEFNNLLQGMLSLVELLGQRLDRRPDTGAVLAELESYVERASRIVTQLMVFSQAREPEPRRLDLAAEVSTVVELLRRLVRENIEVGVELSTQPVPVVVDSGQLEQVLVNLAVNASDAMSDGGQITIRVAPAPPWAVLEVEDTGPGIPAELRDRVFEPFVTTKVDGHGTGLGLAAVHGIVSAADGEVEYCEAPRGGALFRIRLPLDESPRTGLEDPAPPSATTVAGGDREREVRVLLVEDEPAARDGLDELLQALGCDVAAVEDAAGAETAWARFGPFDLLITDYQLPDRTGVELIESLRRREPAVAVILMSGYAEDQTVREAVRSGDLFFLQKPFGFDRLRRAIDEVLPA